MSTALLWFRNDLRLTDNLALQAALSQSDQILPLYVFDEQWLVHDQYGFFRTGPFRLQFLLQSLTDLKKHLQELGSDLLIRRGKPAEIIPTLVEEFDCSQVFCSKEYTSEEIQVEQALKKKVPFSALHNSTLIHPEDVIFDIHKMPEVFTTFRKKVERYSKVRESIPSPTTISSPNFAGDKVPALIDFGIPPSSHDERGVLAFKGGAMEAWGRLDHYFWDTECLSTYKETRNGMIGADYSSKFSPWLANGCISPRSIYAEIEKYEVEVEKNKSTYWLKFELLWRDFFRYTAMRYGNRIFHAAGIKDQPRRWKHQPKVVRRWINGETGDELVDANMRELKWTGFMSNRGRQNVASYLVHRLKQDWRVGAAWFESMLIDYDVCSNYGNWIYAAGVGNDPRDRVFNTQRQANMYDKDGAYRNLWLLGREIT